MQLTLLSRSVPINIEDMVSLYVTNIRQLHNKMQYLSTQNNFNMSLIIVIENV